MYIFYNNVLVRLKGGNAGHTELDVHNYACIILYFLHYMLITNGYMFSWFLH